MGRRTKRKVLERSNAPVGLWVDFILAAAYAGFSVFLLVSAFLSGRSVLWLLVTSVLAALSVAIFVSIWRVLSRKIVFLDKYISYTGLLGRPKTYRYEDIVDVKAVIIPDGQLSRWVQWEFEDNMTIVFADGEKLRIPTTAMKPREVRRRIESKTGLKFESTLKL